MTSYIESYKGNIKNDVLSGMTVALALVPEAVAFAFVAGVDPMVGLYAAFMIGLITAVLGGRPGMISGATGALAVVMVSLVAIGNAKGLQFEAPIENAGLYYLFLTVILMGFVQIFAGFMRLGKFVRLIPHPVMMGFVNGLAIVIFLSQLGMFQHFAVDDNGMRIFETNASGLKEYTRLWLPQSELLVMLALVGLTMFIMWGLPKLTKLLPGALTAIIVVSLIVIFGGLDVSTVGSFIHDGGGKGLKGSLPTPVYEIFSSQFLNWETFKFIAPYSLILAAIGLIESLMTLNLIDEITETRGSGNRECIAQGVANIVTGIFGGMGGCAMIGQSLINIESGGRTRLSGVVAAVTLLIFILFAAPLIEQIPIAALVGVMFMVVIGTFAWSSFRIMNKIPLSDAFIVILVSALTVIFDLAIAVFAGVIVSALVFSWENAKKIRARRKIKEDGTVLYEVWGPLFFGSIKDFNAQFDIKNDPNHVEIDFIESRVSDHSALEALWALILKYQELGKEVKLLHLSNDCKKLLYKASPVFHDVIIEDVTDPRYYVLEDNETYA